MKQYYFKLDGFLDEDQVKKVLEKDYIVKHVTFKTKFQYAVSNGMGLEPTGEFGYENTTREVAIPKSTPDLVITEDNYGEYLTGVVFDSIFLKKLFEIVTREL